MDMLSRILKPIKGQRPPNETMVTDPSKAWPASPAVHGKYYGFTDNRGATMVAMTKETWEQLGTIMEQQRRSLVAQDTAIKAQSKHIQELTADRDDVLQKLTNLRSSHRELLQ